MKNLSIIIASLAMFFGFAVEAQASKEIKVISFNITVSNSDGENMWGARRGAVVNLITEEQPDVVGMQEATVFQLKQLEPLLSGYEFYYVARGGRNSPNECTAVAVNKATMEVVDKDTFWLSSTPELPSRSWSDDKTTQLELALGGTDSQKYHRTCTWVKLRRKADGKVLRLTVAAEGADAWSFKREDLERTVGNQAVTRLALTLDKPAKKVKVTTAFRPEGTD